MKAGGKRPSNGKSGLVVGVSCELLRGWRRSGVLDTLWNMLSVSEDKRKRASEVERMGVGEVRHVEQCCRRTDLIHRSFCKN